MYTIESMDIPNNYFRVSIKALVFNEENKFLLFQEKSGIWELPGGGLDHGETPEDCLRRELREEAGLEVVSIKERPSYVTIGKTAKGNPKVNVTYEVILKDLNFTPTDECIEIRFFTKDEALLVNLQETVRNFVDQL